MFTVVDTKNLFLVGLILEAYLWTISVYKFAGVASAVFYFRYLQPPKCTLNIIIIIFAQHICT